MSESKRCRQPLINGLNMYGMIAYPIETGRTRRGVSDIIWNFKGLVVWIECKEVDCDETDQIVFDFEPLQKKFLLDNAKEGGLSLVCARTNEAFVFTHIDNITERNRIKENRHILVLKRLDIPVLLKWVSLLRQTTFDY